MLKFVLTEVVIMTRGDKILIVFVLIVSILVYICFGAYGLYKDKTYVVIEVDGEIYEKFIRQERPENKNRCSCNFRKNVIEVDRYRVRMVHADCPDNDCVRQGWISCPGQIIVCLPNRVVIKIIASKNLPDEPDAVSF